MKAGDLISESYGALTVNKARSTLTMLGIIIGIASVIAMVAIGQGASASVQKNIQSIGSNLIIVTPGAQKGPGAFISEGRGSSQTLTMADEQAIASQVSLIKGVAPELARPYQVIAKGSNTNTRVIGTNQDYPIVRNVSMQEGSFITAQEVRSDAKAAVLGPTTASDLFPAGTDPVGQTIRINSIEFKVIGVMQSKGGSGFFNQDDMVIIPISTAQHYLAGPNANGQYYVSDISISATDQQSMSAVQQQVQDLLLQRHKISDPSQADFTIQNQADIVSAASSVTGTFTILLASIAGISLVVGGIGIMNMMLTTVTERTREIGLRKAIGATRRDINLQFLAESIILTFLGGAIGIALGWLLALLASHFLPIQAVVSTSSILLAFGVSAFIGVAFGYYPALRASRLDPIVALRFE